LIGIVLERSARKLAPFPPRVEGDHVGELEVNLLVVAQKAVEVVVVRIGELQLVKNLVEDSWVVMECAEWGWNVLEDLDGDQEVAH